MWSPPVPAAGTQVFRE
ncbi:hypothetical protein OYC64_004347 [Pagothenia borchgrevinki]|uniref:Uncharacterized protein n=1 Tax=Pagothenia borchgrevinki TaxID=8213 RepID=A0ABD2FWZ8_PAGBO